MNKLAWAFDATGQPIQAAGTIPAPGGGTSAPTGVATNGTFGFVISSGGNSGPSTELFATEHGTIAGWNNNVDPTHAVITVDNSASGTIYKGLAIGFKDPKIPTGFAPFGIASFNAKLYVTYQALSRLFVLPGSTYTDPEFNWKWAVAPAAIGFAGSGLGSQHSGDLFVDAARTFLDGGYLFEFKFDQSRKHFAFSDPGLKDKVDNNDYKFDEGQSEGIIAGENFGIVTNIVTGADGNLYVPLLSNGTVYIVTNTNP